MDTYLENLEWRYATKRYNEAKKISDADLATIKEALRLSASSYGLQPYKILVIEDEETRKKLREVSWNQPQITDSSYLVVFANYTSITRDDVDAYMKNISKTRAIDLEQLAPFKQTIEGTTLKLSEDQQQIWAAKQTYIALGNLLSTMAHLRIDATPMEGFDAKAYDKILGLTEKGLATSVIAAIGYRSEEDKTQHLAKVRKDSKDLFITI